MRVDNMRLDAIKLVRRLSIWEGRAISASMAPLINEGDIIEFKKQNPGTINPLDIIAFSNKGKIIVHRVVSIKKQRNKHFFLTKGDNLFTQDKNRISEEAILGVATVIKNRYKSIFLSNNLHHIFYMVSPRAMGIKTVIKKIIYSNKINSFIKTIINIWALI